jgi:hypothetical protein
MALVPVSGSGSYTQTYFSNLSKGETPDSGVLKSAIDEVENCDGKGVHDLIAGVNKILADPIVAGKVTFEIANRQNRAALLPEKYNYPDQKFLATLQKMIEKATEVTPNVTKCREQLALLERDVKNMQHSPIFSLPLEIIPQILFRANVHKKGLSLIVDEELQKFWVNQINARRVNIEDMGFGSLKEMCDYFGDHFSNIKHLSLLNIKRILPLSEGNENNFNLLKKEQEYFFKFMQSLKNLESFYLKGVPGTLLEPAGICHVDLWIPEFAKNNPQLKIFSLKNCSIYKKLPCFSKDLKILELIQCNYKSLLGEISSGTVDFSLVKESLEEAHVTLTSVEDISYIVMCTNINKLFIDIRYLPQDINKLNLFCKKIVELQNCPITEFGILGINTMRKGPGGPINDLLRPRFSPKLIESLQKALPKLQKLTISLWDHSIHTQLLSNVNRFSDLSEITINDCFKWWNVTDLYPPVYFFQTVFKQVAENSVSLRLPYKKVDKPSNKRHGEELDRWTTEKEQQKGSIKQILISMGKVDRTVTSEPTGFVVKKLPKPAKTSTGLETPGHTFDGLGQDNKQQNDL